jgi:undecaprenyl-diphosphatase
VIAAGVLWFRGARLIVALAPGLALAVAGACAAIGKQWVGRARPPLRLHLITETEPSFPSGHATDSSAFFLTLALIVAVVILRRPLARVGTVLLAALLCAAIGVSRLILGVHWPTDVLGGWSLGATVAFTVTLLTVLLIRLVPLDELQRRHRFARVLLVARPRRPSIASRS